MPEKTYSVEFKLRAVNLAQQDDMTISQAARDSHRVSLNTSSARGHSPNHNPRLCAAMCLARETVPSRILCYHRAATDPGSKQKQVLY